MSTQGAPSTYTNLKHRSRELHAFAAQLNEEYAQLLETSLILRQESRELSHESHVLRQALVRLARPNPS